MATDAGVSPEEASPPPLALTVKKPPCQMPFESGKLVVHVDGTVKVAGVSLFEGSVCANVYPLTVFSDIHHSNQ